MFFDQKSPVHRERILSGGTDRQTHRHTTNGHCDLETESAQWANSVEYTNAPYLTLPAQCLWLGPAIGRVGCIIKWIYNIELKLKCKNLPPRRTKKDWELLRTRENDQQWEGMSKNKLETACKKQELVRTSEIGWEWATKNRNEGERARMSHN